MPVRLVQRAHPLQMVPAVAETESLQISARLNEKKKEKGGKSNKEQKMRK